MANYISLTFRAGAVVRFQDITGFSANNKGGLQNGLKDNYAIGFVQQVVGDIVGNIENFLQHRATIR